MGGIAADLRGNVEEMADKQKRQDHRPAKMGDPKELKEDPNAHNAIVTSWNPEYLYTMAEKKDASRFPVCHNMYQISNRKGKLSLILYQRSCDLFWECRLISLFLRIINDYFGKNLKT